MRPHFGRLQQTKMRVCSVFVILLSCRLSHAPKSPSTCISKDLKLVCVPAGGRVDVPCPELGGDDMAFTLLKDENAISNQTCAKNNNELNCTAGLTKNSNKWVGFTVGEVDASSYGVYRCQAIVKYPPPFIKKRSAGILVRVEGHQCKLKQDGHVTPKRDGKDALLWIWILGLALLSTYSLIITIVAAVICVKWRSVDVQSDYINTKPKAARGHGRRRGVQIHVPRHFRSPVHHLPNLPR